VARKLIIIAAVLFLAFPGAGEASQGLSKRRAASEADQVAGFVAEVLSTKYRVRRFGVQSCSARSSSKVACRLRWDVTGKRTRTHWRCATRLVVSLVDAVTGETEWDYGPIPCVRDRSHSLR
jgi:hypothetical protein